MLGQRHSGSFVRTNFVLSILSFLLVLYSTFLTRSGVLGDTSVHSFVDPGKWAYWLLMTFIGVFAALGFGLFFRRLREMPTFPVRHSFLSREYVLFIGATALTSIAILVAIGTSAPIITSILKGKPSAMDVSYYVKTNLPLGVIVTFLSGFAQLLWWKNTQVESLLRHIAVPAILALFPSGLILLMGRESFFIHLFVYCASFSLFANLQVIYEIIRGNSRFAGGAIAHIGIALMSIGFITSAQYSEKKTVSLEEDKPMDLLGYQMTYRGYHQRDDGKYAFTVEVEQEGRKYAAVPIMYFSEQTQNVIRNPDIINFFRRDVYIEPLIVEDTSKSEEQQIELQKEISKDYEGLRLTFTGFDFPENQRAAMMEGKSFQILAFLHVSEGKRNSTISLKMKRTMERATFFPTIYKTKDNKRYEFTFARIVAPQGDSVKAAVEFIIRQLENQTSQKKETLTIEATIKPFINLVWTGTVILIFGFVVTFTRLIRTSKRQQ
jgi:cytochrome c-type biogenesis protein CcmF